MAEVYNINLLRVMIKPLANQEVQLLLVRQLMERVAGSPLAGQTATPGPGVAI